MTIPQINLPSDNTFVDMDRKILNQWRAFFDRLKPLTRLSADELEKLITFIADGDGFIGAGASGAEGDIPVRQADAWGNLSPGAVGSALVIGKNGLPSYINQETSFGRTLLNEYDAAGLTSVVLGPFDGAIHSQYEIELVSLEQGVASGTLKAEISADSSFSALVNIYGVGVQASAPPGAAGYGSSSTFMAICASADGSFLSGVVTVSNFEQIAGFTRFGFNNNSYHVPSSSGLFYSGGFRPQGVVTPYLRISISGGTWLSGSFRVYSVK